MNIKYNYQKKLSKWLACSLLVLPFLSVAQDVKTLSLKDAIALGLANSKTIALSQNKVAEAQAAYQQVLDKSLPSANASAIYNHAEIPNNVLQLGPGDPIKLPKSADAYIGTLSVQELIFAGNKLKYAKESAQLVKKIAVLDVVKDEDEIAINIINAYLNLYKLDASKSVIAQNIKALETQLKQTQRFFDQGIVTKNEVLRIQLQQSNIELTDLDLDKNRNVVNYNLDILLGLPEQTLIQTATLPTDFESENGLSTYLDSAIVNRVELKQIDYQSQVLGKNIASIKADQLPSLGAGLGAYYLNPSGKFIPGTNEFVTPLTLGLTLSWNIGSLWTTKNKVAEAHIKQQGTLINKSLIADQIKSEVNRNYQDYLQSIKKISLLKTAINQATENDNIVQSKYKNSISPLTDRLDANTQLFQAKINLELAKADAQIAYYNLLKSTGKKIIL
ncbi:TolC family protein [Pedobacter arcticus]|uniref:TolC family protein n=1 Tax=Pedobacter arcticus TaxID=752140 RepID=UPI0002DF9E29|nr:TolC family protein [Pedobacter arcticus]